MASTLPAKAFMLAQKTVWSSGLLSATPSYVRLMREASVPRMRKLVSPSARPLSDDVTTEGVIISSQGKSRPVLLSRSSRPSSVCMAMGTVRLTALVSINTSSSATFFAMLSVLSLSAAIFSAGSRHTNRSNFFISYVGIIRIRFKGIISASWHPYAIFAAKIG